MSTKYQHLFGDRRNFLFETLPDKVQDRIIGKIDVEWEEKMLRDKLK